MNNQTTNKIPLKVNPENMEETNCEECESIYFVEVYTIKRISPVLSPSGKEMFIPVQTFKCAECAHVNKNFNN